ncbi:mammalian cell entry protein [Mycobacterium paraffinicum]|uniref:Mammalian cell entry protein n=1 Tax=Mycobacterium paraffinicum TaxID=53378 RepID=A0A1Q4I318_9MYCO|nr:mammalian cell entry protein [Mycobacterium paraffinicum]
MNVNSLPQPGKSYRGGYEITLQFENVLNLPDRAKVVMGGTEVGTVTGVKVTSRQVDVTAKIDPSVSIPSNIHAALEQATVLGDIYLSLSPPDDQPPAPRLTPGSTIMLGQTTSPPQLEDTLAHLADFVSSGSIQRLQNTIIGVNRITPPEPALRNLASRVSADLGDLSDNIDVVDRLLNSVSETGTILHDRLSSAQYWFSPRGMRGFDRAMQTSNYLGRLFPSVGSVYTGGYWLVPFLESAVASTDALRRSKWAFEDEWPAWHKLFTDTFLPEDKYPAINITSIVGPDGRELSGNVTDVLRILGAAP